MKGKTILYVLSVIITMFLFHVTYWTCGLDFLKIIAYIAAQITLVGVMWIAFKTDAKMVKTG